MSMGDTRSSGVGVGPGLSCWLNGGVERGGGGNGGGAAGSEVAMAVIGWRSARGKPLTEVPPASISLMLLHAADATCVCGMYVCVVCILHACVGAYVHTQGIYLHSSKPKKILVLEILLCIFTIEKMESL